MLEVRAGYRKVNYSFILIYEDISALHSTEFMDSGSFSLGGCQFAVAFCRNHAGSKAVQVKKLGGMDCRAEFTFRSEDGGQTPPASVTVPVQDYTNHSPSSAIHIMRSLVCQDSARLHVDVVVCQRKDGVTVAIPPADIG